MHVLSLSGGAWNFGGSVITFLFPMILFVVVASTLFVLYTAPQEIPGHAPTVVDHPVTYTAMPRLEDLRVPVAAGSGAPAATAEERPAATAEAPAAAAGDAPAAEADQTATAEDRAVDNGAAGSGDNEAPGTGDGA